MLTANSAQTRKARSTTSSKPQSGDGKENSPPEADRHIVRKSETWEDWEEPWPERSSRSTKVVPVCAPTAGPQPYPQSARRLSALAKTRSAAQSNSATHADERWKAVSASADATLIVNGAEWSVSPTQDDDNRLANQLARFEATIVDKGYETIQTIGRVAATFATSLDTAIEQLVETLTVSDTAGTQPRTPGSVAGAPHATPSASNSHQRSTAATDADDASEATSRPPPAFNTHTRTAQGRQQAAAPSAQPAPTPAAPDGGSTAPEDPQKLELRKLRRVRHEYVKLRERHSGLQAELRRHEARLADVCEENSRLKNQLMVLPDSDPLGDQVREQLQALLAEKAALASENVQLQRQNASLQELLEYSLSQQMLALEASDCRALATPLPRAYASDDAEDVYQSDDDVISGSLFDKVDE